MDATGLFESVMDWIREHYAEYRFFTERDIVWTVQMRLLGEIERQNLNFRVFNDHRMMPNTRADVAILEDEAVILVAEFKYEPHPNRSTKRGGDIWHSKLPVLIWTEVEKDVERAQNYVSQGRARVAYSVVIDEGGRHNWRTPTSGSEWRDWGSGQWALWSRWQ